MARAILDRRPLGTGAPDLVPRLLAWYDAHARTLPWRGVRDPYLVWVSEVMLQQTRVDTVIPYFERWMRRFPTVQRLAAASEEDVLAAWAGLGYYSRARNLHRGAKVVVAEHGGVLPEAVDALRTIPGIGPYTAGAIASIAFRQRVPAVDGNVLRVFARLDDDRRDVRDTKTRAAWTEVAAGLVPPQRPGDWNQALMDLGATVCTEQAPRCEACPVNDGCRAYTEGTTNEVPVRARRAAPKEERRHFAALIVDGHVLLTKTEGTLLGGLWSLPGAATKAALDRHLQTLAPGARLVRPLGEATHRFTHRRWTMVVHEATGPASRRRPGDAASIRWAAPAELPGVPLSRAQRKCLALAGVLADDGTTPSGS